MFWDGNDGHIPNVSPRGVQNKTSKVSFLTIGAVYNGKVHWCILYRMKKKACFLFSFLLFAPLTASAQFGVGGADALTLTLTPERPGAYTRVEAELESFVVDLSRSFIRWSVNGKVITEGDGEVSAVFETGAFGETTRLSVSALTFDGQVLSKTIALRPAEVQLIWQARSYTPPFYKGKALFPLQGVGTVIAVPAFPNGEGGFMNPKELIYNWSEGGEATSDGSGFGKDVFAVIGRIPIRPLVIGVDVATRDGTLNGRGEITIEAIQPVVRLYEDHPLYGLRFERALNGTFALSGKEIKVSTVPYYFETNRRGAPAISYDWSLNGAALKSERGSAVTLRRVSDESGLSRLSLQVQHGDKMFQGSDAAVTIEMREEEEAFGATP